MRQEWIALLGLYPVEYRMVFGPEIVDTLQQGAMDARRRGALAFTRFAAAELTGLLRGAVAEWSTKWSAGRDYLSFVAAEQQSPPTEVHEAERQLERLIRSMEFAIASHDFPKARFYSNQERMMREQLQRLMT
jgi:hypothetical protein